MARPKNNHKTIQKTYMLYEEDILTINELGKAPKDVYRLGVMALNSGWSPFTESSAVDELKKRIGGLSSTLQQYIDKFNKLAQIVEKGLNVDIDPEVMKTKELEKRLQELELLEKTYKNGRTNKN